MINKGFTLLEVLIALLAAAIISIMSFDFLSNTVFLKDRIDKTKIFLKENNFFNSRSNNWFIISQDLIINSLNNLLKVI